MKPLLLAVLCLAAVPCFAGQQFDFPSQAVDDPAALAKAMPTLALAVIPSYQDDNRLTYLDNLFRLADETMADAGEPLQVQWSGNSYIDIPTHH